MVSAVFRGLASFQEERHEFSIKVLLLLWKNNELCHLIRDKMAIKQ